MSQASSAQCSLFRLPHNLRLQIYRHVLDSGTTIVGNTKGPQQPALLRCCRELRLEAIAFYYTEYHSIINLTAYHVVEAEHFMDTIRRHNLYKVAWNCTLRSAAHMEPHWGNLSSWLRLFHERPLPDSLAPIEQRLPCVMDVTPAFYMVQALLDEPWISVEQVLIKFRAMLAKRDARWEASNEGQVSLRVDPAWKPWC